MDSDVEMPMRVCEMEAAKEIVAFGCIFRVPHSTRVRETSAEKATHSDESVLTDVVFRQSGEQRVLDEPTAITSNGDEPNPVRFNPSLAV